MCNKSRFQREDTHSHVKGKVDTAETGDGGDFKLFTVAPLDKIDPPFPYVEKT